MRRTIHKKRSRALPIFLLAISCIAAAELVACRIADPELYGRFTAKVQQGVDYTVQAVQKVYGTVSAAGREAASWASQTGRQISTWFTDLLPDPGSGDTSQVQIAEQVALAPPQPIAAPSVCDLAARDGLEYLTGSSAGVVYFNQTDSQWAEQPFGFDPIGSYGCGPTAMAMAVSTLTDTIVDPAQMAQAAAASGYCCPGHGSYLSIVQGLAQSYGLHCTSLTPETIRPDDLLLHLSTGSLVVALVGKGHFTNNSHFILLHGVTLDGQVLVADPASRERSLTPWDMSLILGELTTVRADGSPLWLLSAE